jgi:hypothetical protein
VAVEKATASEDSTVIEDDEQAIPRGREREGEKTKSNQTQGSDVGKAARRYLMPDFVLRKGGPGGG